MCSVLWSQAIAHHALQFSSTPAQHRAHGLLSQNRATLPGTTYSNLRLSQTNKLIRNAASVRFASTTPLPAPTLVTNASSTTTTDGANSAATGIPTASASEVSSNITSSLDSATDFTSESLYDIPEHIGYLHELGLQFGIGPTSLMQWIIEHIHIYAGTPWWVSISLAAIAMRAVLFKAYIGAADNAARMQTIMPITQPLTTKMQEANRAGNTDLVMQLRAEMQMISSRAGVKLWKGFVPMLQVFAGFGTFRLLKAMSAIPVPGLETGGFLWIYNLSVPDPFLVLPIATAAVLHTLLRKGGEMGSMNLSPEMTKALMWGFPALSLLCTWWLPASVQISFFVSGLLSMGQATLFRKDWFRNYFNMIPLPAKKTPNAPGAPKFRGDLKIAAPFNPVLSQSQLNSRFQDAGAAAEKKAGVIGEITGAFSGVVEKGREKLRDNSETSQAKRQIQDKKAYELKRREEIRLARKEEIRLENLATKARRAKRAKLASKEK
ncbi:Mitochondrial inner membrane protein oxa1 [Cadophora gregata f. sp. sojae]|nr:Mitochondrial inner membrane protein oxa1 [Cadophora gregata f. sp. sojae]